MNGLWDQVLFNQMMQRSLNVLYDRSQSALMIIA